MDQTEEDPEFWNDLYRSELAELLAIHPEQRTREDQVNIEALAQRLQHGAWEDGTE